MRGHAVVPLVVILAVAVACGGGVSRCPDEAREAIPSPPWHDDPELEDRIPDTVAGRPFEVQTYCATTTSASEGLNTAPEFLEAIGADATDLTVARSAPPPIGETDDYTGLSAWRYRGAAEETLRDTFLKMYTEMAQEAGIDDEISEATMAGKTVHESDAGVFYFSDDTIYVVYGADCEEVVAALP